MGEDRLGSLTSIVYHSEGWILKAAVWACACRRQEGSSRIRYRFQEDRKTRRVAGPDVPSSFRTRVALSHELADSHGGHGEVTLEDALSVSTTNYDR